MLQSAVAELWEEQKSITQAHDSGGEAHQGLTLAIAKVQFIQVYLDDPDLPISSEEAGTSEQASTPINDSTNPTEPLTLPPNTSPRNREPNAAPPTASATAHAQNHAQVQAQGQAPPPIPQTPHNASSATSPPAPAPHEHRPPTQPLAATTRPLLAQSSFSWMLERTAAPSSDAARTAFVSATHFTPAPPSRASRDMGFLFGEPDVVGGGAGGGAGAGGVGASRRAATAAGAKLAKGAKEEKGKGRKDERDRAKARVEGGGAGGGEEEEEEGEAFVLGPLNPAR